MPRRTRTLSITCLLVLLTLPLGGCLVPQNAIARIKIERDGAYRAFAEGTAVQPEAYRAVRAVEAEAGGGKLKPEELKKRQDEAQSTLVKDLEAFRKDPRVLETKSTGDGRVRFTLDGAWRLDRGVLVYHEMLAPLAYSVAADGTIRLRVKDAMVQREATALGVASEFDVSVVLAEGIEVLEHNAQRAPTSPNGAYRWHIDKPGAPLPYLRIRLPEPAATGGEQKAEKPQKARANH